MDFPLTVRRVVLAVLARFNLPRPLKLSLRPDAPRALQTLPQWFKDKAEPVSTLFIPSRVNTTFPSPAPCRIANVMIGVVTCLSFDRVPLFAADTPKAVTVQGGAYVDPANTGHTVENLKQAGFRMVRQSTTHGRGHHG